MSYSTFPKIWYFLHQVCDNVVDCRRSYADESLCTIGECPKNCVCQSGMVSCVKQELYVPPPTIGPGNKYIQLSYNYISEDRLNTFYLPHLVILNISHNRISNLMSLPFFSIVTLQTLDLSSNQLNRIYKKAFTKLPSLRKLYLENNKLHLFDNGALLFKQTLWVLHIQNNTLHFSNRGYNFEIEVIHIKSDLNMVCCHVSILYQNDSCTKVKCHRLIPNTDQPVAIFIMTSIVIISAAASFSVSIIFQRRQRMMSKAKHHNTGSGIGMILLSFNFHKTIVNMLVTVYLIIIFHRDFVLKSDFHLESTRFYESHTCAFIGLIAFFCYLFLTLVTNMETILGTMIVRQSFGTVQNRQSRFRITLAVIWITSVLITIFIGFLEIDNLCLRLHPIGGGTIGYSWVAFSLLPLVTLILLMAKAGILVYQIVRSKRKVGRKSFTSIEMTTFKRLIISSCLYGGYYVQILVISIWGLSTESTSMDTAGWVAFVAVPSIHVFDPVAIITTILT